MLYDGIEPNEGRVLLIMVLNVVVVGVALDRGFAVGTHWSSEIESECEMGSPVKRWRRRTTRQRTTTVEVSPVD